MKGIHEMSDRELMDYQYEQKEVMQREDDPFRPSRNVTIEQREAALDALHEIRLEGWRRGWNGVPTEDRRADFERFTARNAQRLERAKAIGSIPSIYAMMDMVRTNEDRIAWIDSHKD